MKNEYVYLDNAATTKVLPEVGEVTAKYFQEQYYNPSALYGKAIEVSRCIKSAREDIASVLGVEPDTIIFTSSGSESDNQALFCSHKKKGSKILIGESEHSAVYNSAMELKQRGFDVVTIKTDNAGRIDLTDLENNLDESVSLVSVMHVNNVTGAINDLKAISDIIKKKSHAIFHSDGVQAFGKIPVKPKSLGVDLYSMSSHKIGAPKGSGFLYVKKGLTVAPLIYGGGQEKGVRSSTENVPCIMGFALAAKIAYANLSKLKENSEKFFNEIRKYVDQKEDVKILSQGECAPHILCLDFKSVRGETLMHALEEKGYLLGIGSACSSKKGTPRIPKALGLGEGYKEGLLRISVNAYDDYDANAFITALDECVEQLKKYVRV